MIAGYLCGREDFQMFMHRRQVVSASLNPATSPRGVRVAFRSNVNGANGGQMAPPNLSGQTGTRNVLNGSATFTQIFPASGQAGSPGAGTL